MMAGPPHWPTLLYPQHVSVPSGRVAHVVAPPTATEVKTAPHCASEGEAWLVKSGFQSEQGSPFCGW